MISQENADDRSLQSNGRLAFDVFVRLAFKISRLVGMNDFVFSTFINRRAELRKRFLSSLLVATRSCFEGLSAKAFHAASE